MSNYGAVSDSDIFYPSKAALRRAVANGENVRFFDTSAFSNKGTVGKESLQPSDVIVGPDPYTSRKWYANIKNGKVV